MNVGKNESWNSGRLRYFPSVHDVHSARFRQIDEFLDGLVSHREGLAFLKEKLHMLPLHRAPLIAFAQYRDDGHSLMKALINHLTLTSVSSHAVFTLALDGGMAGTADGRTFVAAEENTQYIEVETLQQVNHKCFRQESAVRTVGLMPGDRGSGALILAPVSEASNIALCAEGPIARAMLSEAGRFAPLDEHQSELFMEKFLRAERVLRRVWPEFFDLLAAYIAVIVPTTVPETSRARVIRHGASRKDLPGAILMNDYHRNEISIAELCENIVHETVHNLLFALEDVSPWFKEDAALNLVNESVPSPWSKRKLPLYSYFHSLIVFDLINEWNTRVVLSNELGADPGSLDHLHKQPEKFAKGLSSAKATWSTLDVSQWMNDLGVAMMEEVLAT